MIIVCYLCCLAGLAVSVHVSCRISGVESDAKGVKICTLHFWVLKTQSTWAKKAGEKVPLGSHYHSHHFHLHYHHHHTLASSWAVRWWPPQRIERVEYLPSSSGRRIERMTWCIVIVDINMIAIDSLNYIMCLQWIHKLNCLLKRPPVACLFMLDYVLHYN